ncbi:MAG: PAS domain S-box protein, partial [Chloroflexota bacterium]
MTTPIRVLVLEDRPADAELIELELRRAGFELDWTRVDSKKDFLANLSEDLDIILSDYSMPQFDALRALSLLQETGLDIPLIVVTGSFEAQAIECMKQGAADYLIKDRLGRLGPAVSQAIQERTLRREKRKVEQALRESEARFRSVAESAVDGLVLVDDNGEIGYWNPAAEQIFGYPEEEMLGQRLALLLAGQDRERFEAGIESFKPGGEPLPLGRR